MAPFVILFICFSRSSSSSAFLALPRETYYDGLVQERRNSSAFAMELRFLRTNPSINSLYTEFCFVYRNRNAHDIYAWYKFDNY